VPRTKPALHRKRRELAVKNTPAVTITEENIARRAYALYEATGREDGHDLEHWLQASANSAEKANHSNIFFSSMSCGKRNKLYRPFPQRHL
jgi:hypothetical protein